MNKEFRLPDTGQTSVFSKDGREIRVSPEDELFGQDGCFDVNQMSFTKLGEKGEELPDSATVEDGYCMARDNNTGLIWEIKSSVPGDVNYCEDTYSWTDAQGSYIKKLNAKKYGGFNDWRLPNKDELRSLIDYSRTNPAVDSWYFPNCKSVFYWTSVPYRMEPPFVWGIFFGLGSGICYTPTSLQYVRAVRGGFDQRFGTQDTSRFKDNGDGTITDSLTGLMWQKNENERMDWYGALKTCRKMALAGYTDWRLPNIKELNTILNLAHTDGWWYYKTFFPAEGLQPPLLHYFSSTSYEGIYAWVTNFCFGYDGYYAGKGAKLLFRAVRTLKAPEARQKNFALAHTGQMQCYNDEGKPIAQPRASERFYGQDGSLILAPLSFNFLREYGKEVEDTLSWEDGVRMVRDNNTGLIWEVKSPHATDINYREKRYSFADAQNYIQELNRCAYAGFTDWRIPHREELRSIALYNGDSPAVDKKYFSDCLPTFYWATDVYAKNPDLIWGVYFAYGCAICYSKDYRYHVRAVRSGYNPNFGDPARYSFKDNGDGTVTDLNTNLMWKKDESPDANWEEALKYSQQETCAGYTDWRLPTIREIATLIDLSCKDGCWHHKEVFPNVKTLPQGFYWASTTYGDTLGWGVNFQFGYDGYYAGKRKGKYPFRPVRTVR